MDPTERLGSGPVQSRIMPIEREDSVAEEDKTVFDWCKEGNVERLQAALTPGNVDSRDEQASGTKCVCWVDKNSCACSKCT